MWKKFMEFLKDLFMKQGCKKHQAVWKIAKKTLKRMQEENQAQAQG
jgi:hypothetical protein